MRLALLAALLLSACAPIGQAPATSTPVPSPEVTATPVYALPAEVSLLPGETPAEWFVIGLAQAGPQAVANPQVQIVLADRLGVEIARRTIDLPFDILPARTGWPFQEMFSQATTPATVGASLVGDVAEPGHAPPASAEVVRTFLDVDGSTLLLGKLTIESDEPTEIVSIGLLGKDEVGAMTDVLRAQSALYAGPSDPAVPFLADIPPSSAATTWEPFPVVRRIDTLPPPIDVMLSDPMVDGQGNRFLAVVFGNSSGGPVWIRAIALMLQDSAWLAAETTELPLPLGSGAEQAASFRIPASALDQDEAAEDPEWRVYADATPAEVEQVPLAAEVVGYEPVGSTLLLRIRLSAPESGGVNPSAAYAALRSETGPLVSSAVASGPALSAGEDVVLVLALPLPKGFNLTTSAIDVRGGGLPVPP